MKVLFKLFGVLASVIAAFFGFVLLLNRFKKDDYTECDLEDEEKEE